MSPLFPVNPIQYVFFHYTGEKKNWDNLFVWEKKNVCVFISCSKWDVLCMFCAHHPCIRYQHTIIICTLLHRAHGVCTYSYFMSRMFVFFYTCACVRFFFLPEKQWNNWHVSSNWLDVCFSKCACVCHVILSLLFIVRENKSPKKMGWMCFAREVFRICS